MKLFDVYPVFPIEIVKGENQFVWDKEGIKYLDFYGGHAVISIGHSNPVYVNALQEQVASIGFYSNSIEIPLQNKLAEQLGELCAYPDYQLFLTNSGAESVENALKLASFHTNRKKILSFSGSFHGRTSLAVAVTDNESIKAPVNLTDHSVILNMNDRESIKAEISSGDYAAVILEGMQGIGGIIDPGKEFFRFIRNLCNKNGTVLIVDEIQSGYGRTGAFFAHQQHGVKADIITMAKGMGNGFPMGGILIAPEFQPKYGLLGTTFGGNHLACSAGIAVLKVMKEAELIDNAAKLGRYLKKALAEIPEISEVRGEGLMIGIDIPNMGKAVRQCLLFDHKIFTGSSKMPDTIRLLPPLTITQKDCDEFITKLKLAINAQK